MSDLSGRLAALSPEKRALLALRMKQKEQGSKRPPLVPGPRTGGGFPLSFTQERLWFLDQLEPGSPIYNIPTALRYTGPLDHLALERALTEIVRRHEALRTVFVDAADAAGGEVSRPVQRISPPQPVHLPLVDLSSLDVAAREAEAHRLATEEALRPFDLGSDLLLRGSLLRLSDIEHIHLITMHHIVSDGWSSGVFVRELAALYAAFTEGASVAAAQLPSLPIQYVDFAAWQRQWLRGDVLEQQLRYWREQLADSPALLDLPTDRPRPAIQTSHGTTQALRLSSTLTAELQAFSQREGVTLFMTVLAAFKILLARYTSQSDVLVGSPIAGRDQVETQGLIGFFVNMLVLRTDLSGDPTVRELLQRVRRTALDAYAHQDVPFEMIVEAVQPERSLSYTPLFQVAFALQNAPMQPLQLKALTVHPPAAKTGVAKYDLYLELTEEYGVLTAIIEYNTDLFDAATIARLLGHYETLLQAIVAAPTSSIATLPLLTAAETEQVLVDFNTTPPAAPLDLSVQQIIEQRAALHPQRIAAQFREQQLSYGDLNRRANQMAHWMSAQGLGRHDRIGIFGERGIEMLVTILACFKIGAAYVPLDPAHPDARIATMLEAGAIRLIVTESSLVARTQELAASSPAAPAILCWDEADAAADWRTLDAQPTENLPLVGQPHDLANIFFTSGSTGTPKGAMVEQIGMLNHIWAKIGVLGMSEQSVLAQNASHCFDISVWQFLSALVVGGRVVIYDNDTALQPLGLLSAIERDEVTVLETVPTMLDAMLQALAEPDSPPISLSHLTYLVSNAETLPVPLARRWMQQFPDVPLINTYGATECSDDTTHYVLRELPAADAARVPVGTPIPGFKIYVLDAHLRPLPIGVPGQIAMAGVGVGQGYLGDAQKTAQTFIPHPFEDGSDSRLYLTGDLGRWNRDGQLEFLGRLDGQVKIRGHRVEIGEVEAALARVEGVRQAVVVARPDRRGQLGLIGYVVADPPLDQAETRAFLRTILPASMLPDHVVSMAAFPVNRNGKVDRRALPAPDESELSSGAAYVAPSTPEEEVIAAIWAHVLGLVRVGSSENFFELGGHSLLATQVISRMRAAFGIDLPLRALFETPTVHGLALTVAARRQQSYALPPIVPVARDGDLPASFAQQRLWFLDQFEPGTPVYHMPTALRLRGPLDTTALAQALSGLIERHEVLRTTFSAVDGQPQQVIHPAAPVSLPQIDLGAWSGADQETEAYRLLTAAVQQPFDLERGPLLRTLLLQLSSDEHLLLIVVHHIVSDGWSTGVMLDDLAALYSAAHAGNAARLTPLAIQYADFAVWQRQWLAPGADGAVLETQLGYWREQLRNATPVLELPTDRPRPPVQTFEGASEKLVLSPALTQSLHTLSQREGVTLFMTLLAGLKIVLYRYTGQEDLLVGTPIAGRNRSETESLIGMFVNTLVLRTNLGDNPSVRELLRRIRETALGAYAHQDVPFEMVVETVQPERSLSHTPLFQVLCVLNNTAALSTAFGDIEVEALADGGAVAKFDLTLALSEDAGALTAALEYNVDLFDAATIARMLGHFETVLEAMVADATQTLATLPLLRAAERDRLLVEANATAKPYQRDVSMYTLFEQQVARNPDAIAVRAAAADGSIEQLSYGELNARANQLAHYLRAQGVAPEVVVGLCVDRSAALLVAVLGILKAGGAYLPLDPTYPADRLQFMLQDANVPLLLTETALLGALPAINSRIVCLDRDGDAIAQESSANPTEVGTAARLAYLIYTSGSTGTPKGVQITHSPVVNIVTHMRDQFTINEHDRMLAITSLSFDISVIDLVLPLSCGALIELVSRSVAADGAQLLARLRDSGATILQATPSSWRLLLQAGWTAETQLRVAITGGEALTSDLATELLPRTASLWNYYGPTETTIWSSFQRVVAPQDALLIGVPVANTALYVLDKALQPVPIGVPGELYIGGDGLARGYLNRPELTAERFIEHPFGAGSGQARLYKTGDLVRFRSDCHIEYIGRLDHQVKLRGFRIELGEIESVLRQHPALEAALVVLREDVPGDPRLVAYVVAHDELPTIDALRQFTQQHLPLYMVPMAFVPLTALPLTPNGKLDRKALPAPDNARPLLEPAYVAPETPTEQTVAAIWAELLGLSQVGVHDNFFTLGGHSILATQLMARITATCGVELPLRSLFEQPTVAALSASIDRERSAAADDEDLTMIADLVDMLDDLSEAEVEALLEQKLLSIRGEV